MARHRPLHRARGRRGLVAAAGALAAAASLAPAVLGSPAATADVGYTQQELHFAVQVGPNRDQACDIVGLLFTPSTATPATPAPAILTTNGFGGSDLDQVPFAQREAARGYVVLSYSGLGFGSSGCKITLDDPDYDGVAASRLVSYLGGADGIAYLDAAHTRPAPVLDVVERDTVDHDGNPSTNDPRVGMWGGSYGGQVQFAAAAVDPRIDVLNPQITWNDLSYSLDPNNTDQPTGVSSRTPGSTKVNWAAGFSAIGILDGVRYAQQDPTRLVGCPNFADFVCPALLFGGATGYLDASSTAKLRHASVSSYLDRIRVPVLLDQGQTDTLFNLNEAIATYRALKAQGTPVAMLWRENGHSGGTMSAAGYQYERDRIDAWFDHYLKDLPTDLGSPFAYYQDWTGTFAQAGGFPVPQGSTRTYILSGGRVLCANPCLPTFSTQTLLTTALGLPTSLDDLDALGSVSPLPLDLPASNAAGTYAYWQTAPITDRDGVTVVGSPTLDVTISAPTALATSLLGPAGQVVLFAKVYDVDGNGAASLIKHLVAPVRIPDPTKSVRITLPAIAHNFAPGHRIRIMLAGGDVNYRGGTVPTAVTIATGLPGQVFRIPVV